MMVFSSTAIAPSGHIIPINGTNLLVLQSLDGQNQVFQPSTVIVQAAQTPAGQKEGTKVFQRSALFSAGCNMKKAENVFHTHCWAQWF